MAVAPFFAIFLLGYTHQLSSNEKQLAHHIINVRNITAYKARVLTPGEEKAKTRQYHISVDHVKTDEGWKKVKGKVIVYVEKSVQKLSYGDEILVNKSPFEIQPPSNPNQFDYKKYINARGIYHQHYLRKEDLTVAGKGTVNPVMLFAYRTRSRALTIFESQIVGPKELSIVQALILGYKNNLDQETKNAYASSGTMHILAVSGLHVGIIYAIFYFLLGRLRSNHKTRWLFAAIVLVVLWFYALVTGFSPSVFRAVTMFSFIIVANASKRSTNIYNTLAASAFVLLLYDPMLILSVGFQLSFLAVFGIVYVQPKIYKLISVENWLLEKAWSLTTVAVAVQVATFPLGLFYFHQFPSYFFLSNLVAIPAAFLILVVGISLLAMSWWSLIADFLGDVLEGVVFSLNFVISTLEKLPFNRISDVHIDAYQMWSVYLLVLSLLLMFSLRKVKFIYPALAGAIFFSVLQWNKMEENKSFNQFTVYDFGRSSAIEFISHNRSTLFTDSILTKTSKEFQFNIHSNHVANGVSTVKFNTIGNSSLGWNGLKFIDYQGLIVLVVDEAVDSNFSLKEKMSVDYIILIQSARVSIQWLNDNFNFEQLVIDKTVRYGRHEKMKNVLEELRIKYHSVRDNGAFAIDL